MTFSISKQTSDLESLKLIHTKSIFTHDPMTFGYQVTSKIPVRWPGECYGFMLSCTIP